MRQLLTLTASDLLQRIRDRSVIIFALVVPMAVLAGYVGRPLHIEDQLRTPVGAA